MTCCRVELKVLPIFFGVLVVGDTGLLESSGSEGLGGCNMEVGDLEGSRSAAMAASKVRVIRACCWY